MIDLGIQKGSKQNYEDEDYYSVFLSDLQPGAEITGEIYISELKTREFKGNEIHEFYLIITDHVEKQKWICGINTSVYEKGGIKTIYGAQGGRVYQIIDSLNHALNGSNLNSEKSYTVVFETFKETINDKVGIVTVETTQSTNTNAKTPNLRIVKAALLEAADEDNKKEYNAQGQLTPFNAAEYNDKDIEYIALLVEREGDLSLEAVKNKVGTLWQEGSLTEDDFSKLKNKLGM